MVTSPMIPALPHLSDLLPPRVSHLLSSNQNVGTLHTSLSCILPSKSPASEEEGRTERGEEQCERWVSHPLRTRPPPVREEVVPSGVRGFGVSPAAAAASRGTFLFPQDQTLWLLLLELSLPTTILSTSCFQTAPSPRAR